MKMHVLMLALLPSIAFANPWWLKGSNAKTDDFLDPDIAFKASARVDGNLIRVGWTIADGYYLYRSKFRIEAESPDLSLEPAVFPNGSMKTDPYLGTQEIYKGSVEAAVGYHQIDAGAHPLQIRVTYQGCAEAGLCYPPLVKILNPQAAATPVTAASATVMPLAATLASTSQATGPAILRSRASIARPVQRARQPLSNSWVSLAIVGGGAAFLLAGFVLRRGRRLDFPAT